jgi:hypothetical protein
VSRRTLGQCRDYRDVHAALSRSPNLASVRNGGPHTVYCGRNGHSVPVPNHRGDVPPGTLRSIWRLAIVAGLALVACAAVAVLL